MPCKPVINVCRDCPLATRNNVSTQEHPTPVAPARWRPPGGATGRVPPGSDAPELTPCFELQTDNPCPRPARTPAGRTPKVKNVFCLKLDAKSIPEALATTILILQKFSIDLAHRYPGHRLAPQDHPRTPPTPPPGPSSTPRPPSGAHWTLLFSLPT